VAVVANDLNAPGYGIGDETVVRTTFTPAVGALANNVYAIEVDFTHPPFVPNNHSGYSEISVFGSPSGALPATAPVVGKPTVSGGNLILMGMGGTPGAGYTWLSTTNLSAPIIWTTNSAGTLDGTGAFSNSIPIGVTPASFFRLRIP
jgi:hypothetical protein